MTKEPGTGNHDSGTRQMLPKPLPFVSDRLPPGSEKLSPGMFRLSFVFLSFHRQYISVIVDILVYQLLNQFFILHLG